MPYVSMIQMTEQSKIKVFRPYQSKNDNAKSLQFKYNDLKPRDCNQSQIVYNNIDKRFEIISIKNILWTGRMRPSLLDKKPVMVIAKGNKKE